ncbi:uncharacterized protein LOC115443508 [Manduca sexta]|uniref:uncharacterized protein LOC115443508 n=1 Tax=Manduca sexta TaxID=7130 RepID=UPI00188F1615|nr:uncharacterized protein LOC115443508 [Manduca sexta]
MDRLNQLRGAAGGSGDSTLDTTSPPSEAFITANESSSKYFSLSEVDSTFDISPIKDVSLASASGDPERTITDADELISELSPITKKNDRLDSYKIGKQIEAANILSGGVDIFDDNDNSYDGDELVIDDNVELDNKSSPELKQIEPTDNITEPTVMDVETDIASKDTEVVLQIDGKNVDAIDIGNGLYLYRKEGQEELAAVQIIDDDQQQPSFKFLKVRENTEGNLEVYEEIEIEVPKEVPVKEGKSIDKNTSHVPIKDINKVINEPSSNKVADRINKTPQKEIVLTASEVESEVKDVSDSKSEVNLNGKMMKFSESRKSPVIGSFTPMTYHSTPNKEGIPLTKTMVDMQLQPSRHSDNIKKTIEVHTDSGKQKHNETPSKIKDSSEDIKEIDISIIDKEETTLEDREPQHKEGETTELEPDKTDMIMEQVDKSNGAIPNEKQETNQIKTPECVVESADIIIDNETEEDNLVLVTDDLPEDKGLTLDCNNTFEENNVKKLLNLPEPKLSIEEKNIQENKELNVEAPDSSKIISHEKNEIEDNKKLTDIQENSGFAPMTSSLSKTEEAQATSLTTTKIMSEKCDAQQEIKDDIIVNIIKENKEEAKVAKTSTVVPDRPIDTTENFNSNTEKACVEEQPQMVSDKEQINPKMAEQLGSLKEKNVSDVTEVNDGKCIKNEKVATEDIKKEINDKIQEENSTTTKAEKQEITAVEIINKVDIVVNKSLVCEKSVENQLMSTEDVKPTTTYDDKNKFKNDKNKLKDVDSEVKDVKETRITISQEKHTDTVPDIKQLNLNIPKEVQVNKQNEINQNSKAVIEKLITSKAEDSQEASRSNIFLQRNVAIDTTKEMKVPLEADSKQTVANNNAEMKLKTENTSNSSKIVPTAPKTNITLNKTTASSNVKNETSDGKKGISKVSPHVDTKPTNNNNSAVPFGKWTEANRQEFLNKIKEAKVPVNVSNSKPIKNSNDLNRRDVLKKIDSQRQSNNAASKAQESTKINIKNENVFTNKHITVAQEPVMHNVSLDSKIPVKVDSTESKNKDVTKKVARQEIVSKPPVVPIVTPVVTPSTVTAAKKEVVQRKALNAQDLIDKTVEGMINKVYPIKLHAVEGKSTSAKDSNVQRNADAFTSQPSAVSPTTLYAIEMKMNELHGIPFIERPPHELPRPHNPPFKNYNKGDKEKPIENKGTKIPNLLPFSSKNPPKVKESSVDVDSEEEILEHEPVTGDTEMAKKVIPSNLALKEKIGTVDSDSKINVEPPKKETIITENDFDKFARRNSVTYENCITMNFDGKEQHNVIQTVVEKDIVKTNLKNELSGVETTPKLAPKTQTVRQNTNTSKLQLAPKVVSSNDDPSNKNYQSKLQIAYQSALTAKRHLEGPITVIEDKPVKVVYVDANPEFIASKLNVQGQNLSPAKKNVLELDSVNTSDSLDNEMVDTIDDKLQDDSKPKTKHQRKQVLTPVEAPELELIEPGDLGIEVSPKKKRKTEDARTDKAAKNVIHKKSYLLGRTPIVEDKVPKQPEVLKNPVKEPIYRNDNIGSKDTVTALDNLVKAAELLENQSESMNTSIDTNTESQPSTPVKRGRGRPRKYPLPEGAVEKVKVPTPQKKPRLIDAKLTKRDTTTEEEETSDEEIVKENWTMGKINENIVCPICNKLFRSENVVFKHVKHCTGPSPNRSDAEKRSVRRVRQSQESDSKSEDMDIDDEISKDIKKYTPKKRRSKDSSIKSDTDKEDIIVIEDTPVKDKSEKEDDRKHHESRKLSKTKIHNRIVNNLVCEFCGKTFRQLSYLANHKLQHKKEDAKKTEKNSQPSKSVLSCEVCKKEFRKLHHLAQHRSIHNVPTVSSRLSRKSSSEQEETKSEKEENSKQNDDPSAGFRCEPCDKSFRKLHHLVEHRETHDGINRQKIATTVPTVVEKITPPPQCDICKKTFRKLHHLIEHKEQHLETSSEKSDDKSVKSSLSTKDIIHECPLCYMVFPNEHSLNKHHIICQRKKRQSKQPKPILEDGETLDMDETAKSEESKFEDNDEPEIISEEVKVINLDKDDEKEKVDAPLPAENINIIEIIENPPPAEVKEIAVKDQEIPEEEEEIKNPTPKYTTTKVEVPSEIIEVKMKSEEKESQKEVEKVQDVPKKKTPAKSKVIATAIKRQKLSTPAPTETDKSPMETSDDDEVRYMLNPNFKADDTSEGKVFMKVRAKKRNSLQIERPNSKDLIKRRTSLQHPPKIPRLKPKPIEPKVTTSVMRNPAKPPKLEPVPSTDSDDSDVKYSFPKQTPERTTLRERSSRELERKPQRKSLTEKRKTLSGIAKRKSLGKSAGIRHKEAASPPKPVKRRTTEVGHRCDCGQLFSSAALLSRHTSLAHTPPRIRKRRSPPPDVAKPAIKPPPKNIDKPKQTVGSRKSSVRSDTSTSNTKSTVTTRKSSVKTDAKTPTDTRKSIKPVEKVEPKTSNAPNAKGRRSIATRTTAIPDKGKKPMQKSKI